MNVVCFRLALPLRLAQVNGAISIFLVTFSCSNEHLKGEFDYDLSKNTP